MEQNNDETFASTKVCTQCKVDKPYTEYHKDSRSRLGLTASCKICNNQRNKRLVRAKNQAKVEEVISTSDEGEEWRDIPNYEGLYKISNKGRVLSTGYHSKYGVISPALSKGYEYVQLYKDGSNHTSYIHRLLALAFTPNPDNYPVVDHIDRNTRNNDLSNLRWCTIQLNTKNRTLRGCLKYRERNRNGGVIGEYRVRWAERDGTKKEMRFPSDRYDDAKQFLDETIDRLNSMMIFE